MAKKKKKGLAGKLRGTSRPAGAGLNQGGRFSPYRAPTRPPPGTYDPSLDAQERAANRGYGDLTRDTERDNERASSGLERSRGRLGQDRGFRLADLLRGRDRGLADIGTDRRREGQDYGERIGGLKRQFQQQGVNQGQQAESQGVSGGGTLRAALKMRQSNEAIERKPIDTGHARFGEDSRLQERRLGENYKTDVERTEVGYNRGLEDAGTDFQYGTDDRATGLDRAGRELSFFGQDIGAQRFFQAAESGRYIAPGRGEPGGMPSNEFSDARGPYRLVISNGRRFRVRPNGQREPAGRR